MLCLTSRYTGQKFPAARGLAPSRSVEIRRFGGDPAYEFGHCLVPQHRAAIIADPRQLGIGEIRMYGFVTNRVHRDRGPALFGLGHRMVPLDQRSERAAAQPAQLRSMIVSLSHCLFLRCGLFLFHRVMKPIGPALFDQLFGADHAQLARSDIAADCRSCRHDRIRPDCYRSD